MIEQSNSNPSFFLIFSPSTWLLIPNHFHRWSRLRDIFWNALLLVLKLFINIILNAYYINQLCCRWDKAFFTHYHVYFYFTYPRVICTSNSSSSIATLAAFLVPSCSPSYAPISFRSWAFLYTYIHSCTDFSRLASSLQPWKIAFKLSMLTLSWVDFYTLT